MRAAAWVKSFLDIIKNAISRLAHTDPAIRALMKEDETLAHIAELFNDAIRESEANRSAEATNSGDELDDAMARSQARTPRGPRTRRVRITGRTLPPSLRTTRVSRRSSSSSAAERPSICTTRTTSCTETSRRG